MRTEREILKAIAAATVYAQACKAAGCTCGCVDIAKTAAVSLGWALGQPSESIDTMIDEYRKAERGFAERN